MTFKLGQHVKIPLVNDTIGVIVAIDPIDSLYPYMVVFNNDTEHDILSFEEYLTGGYSDRILMAQTEYEPLRTKFKTYNWFAKNHIQPLQVLKKEEL